MLANQPQGFCLSLSVCLSFLFLTVCEWYPSVSCQCQWEISRAVTTRQLSELRPFAAAWPTHAHTHAHTVLNDGQHAVALNGEMMWLWERKQIKAILKKKNMRRKRDRHTMWNGEMQGRGGWRNLSDLENLQSAHGRGVRRGTAEDYWRKGQWWKERVDIWQIYSLSPFSIHWSSISPSLFRLMFLIKFKAKVWLWP